MRKNEKMVKLIMITIINNKNDDDCDGYHEDDYSIVFMNVSATDQGTHRLFPTGQPPLRPGKTPWSQTRPLGGMGGDTGWVQLWPAELLEIQKLKLSWNTEIRSS